MKAINDILYTDINVLSDSQSNSNASSRSVKSFHIISGVEVWFSRNVIDAILDEFIKGFS